MMPVDENRIKSDAIGFGTVLGAMGPGMEGSADTALPPVSDKIGKVRVQLRRSALLKLRALLSDLAVH